MEELKKDTIDYHAEIMPSNLSQLIIQLNDCHSHEEFIILQSQLSEMAKSDSCIYRAYTSLLAQYPNLNEVNPELVAKSLQEFYREIFIFLF